MINSSSVVTVLSVLLLALAISFASYIRKTSKRIKRQKDDVDFAIQMTHWVLDNATNRKDLIHHVGLYVNQLMSANNDLDMKKIYLATSSLDWDDSRRLGIVCYRILERLDPAENPLVNGTCY